MSLFNRLFYSKAKPGTVAFRRKRAEELHGQAIRYVTEKHDGNDDVIGRGGSLAVHGDDFLVDSSGDTVFRCKVDRMDAAYLMSGDGVVISGPDEMSDGDFREITVHFVYYRQ